MHLTRTVPFCCAITQPEILRICEGICESKSLSISEATTNDKRDWATQTSRKVVDGEILSAEIFLCYIQVVVNLQEKSFTQ
jgi:hypothetical protein